MILTLKINFINGFSHKYAFCTVKPVVPEIRTKSDSNFSFKTNFGAEEEIEKNNFVSKKPYTYCKECSNLFPTDNLLIRYCPECRAKKAKRGDI